MDDLEKLYVLSLEYQYANSTAKRITKKTLINDVVIGKIKAPEIKMGNALF